MWRRALQNGATLCGMHSICCLSDLGADGGAACKTIMSPIKAAGTQLLPGSQVGDTYAQVGEYVQVENQEQTEGKEFGCSSKCSCSA